VRGRGTYNESTRGRSNYNENTRGRGSSNENYRGRGRFNESRNQTMVEVMEEAKEEEEINNTLEDHKIKEVKICLKSSAKDVFALAMWWKSVEHEMKIFLRINKLSNNILSLMLQLQPSMQKIKKMIMC
jgi:hypothetical protein